MNWKLSFVSGITVLTLLAGAIGMYVYNIPGQQAEQGKWVMHTYQVMNKLETLSGQLNIAAYNDTHVAQHIQETLTAIETLTRDNPTQQARIPSLRQSIANLPASQQSAQPDENKTAIQIIAQQIDTMLKEEKNLLEERNERWHTVMAHTRLWFLSGTVLLYIFMLIAYIASRREARSREQLLDLENETSAMHRGIATHMTQVLETQQDIISQRMNLENAMQTITRRTQSITRADGAVIELLVDDEMVYRSGSGSMKPFVGVRIKAHGSLSGLCVSTATALRCDDCETDDRVDKEACRKVGLRSMIVVPLMQGTNPIGVLKVTSGHAQAFSVDDLSTLKLMAGVLSATLRDALDSEALHDSNKYLSMSNEILKTQNAMLESEKTDLQSLADTDGMTGLKNHRYFQECLSQEYIRARRYKNELSLIMLDIDYFKRFNDDFGHPAGDEVIRQVAAILKDCVRPSDCVARYGGEEFSIILIQTPLEGAVRTAERIRKAIADIKWKKRQITISVGISGLKDDTQDPASIINQADKALYQSKADGRDRITSFTLH